MAAAMEEAAAAQAMMVKVVQAVLAQDLMEEAPPLSTSTFSDMMVEMDKTQEETVKAVTEMVQTVLVDLVKAQMAQAATASMERECQSGHQAEAAEGSPQGHTAAHQCHFQTSTRQM